MELTPNNTAVAVRCSFDGTVEEVIYDELGPHSPLMPGREFASIATPFHIRKARRFLEAVLASSSALDWELNVALPDGVTPLFFSGCDADPGILIFGTKEPLTATLPEKLTEYAEKDSGSLARAFKELEKLRKGRTAVERKLQGEISRLNHAMDRPQADSEAKNPPRSIHSRYLELIEMTVHDLRNPICGILASIEYLLEDASKNLQEQHLNLLKSIESSSQLMLRRLQDMVEISRLEATKGRLRFHSTDIAGLLENALTVNRPLANSKRVSLEGTAGSAVPAVLADTVKISQALNWLVAYTILCSEADHRVEVDITAQPDHVVITLRNEGLSPLGHGLTSVFDPSLATRPKAGLSSRRAALLLSTARRIVDGHGGTITIDEEAGPGWVVTLTLPISPARSSTTGTPQAPANWRAKSTGK
jgi:signal transduction histidine kinase